MSQFDVIRKHLTGTSDEQRRREEILRALLDAFARGGAEAIATDLEDRLDALDRACDEKLQALNALLS